MHTPLTKERAEAREAATKAKETEETLQELERSAQLEELLQASAHLSPLHEVELHRSICRMRFKAEATAKELPQGADLQSIAFSLAVTHGRACRDVCALGGNRGGPRKYST